MAKFCGKCGTPIEDRAKFCGNCGTVLEEVKSGEGAEDLIKPAKKGKGKTIFKFLVPIVLVLAVAGVIIGRGFVEPCTYCGDVPTKGYKIENSNEKQYYCKECSSDCAFCSDKATNHYSSGLGVTVFVCDDCYSGVSELQSWF